MYVAALAYMRMAQMMMTIQVHACICMSSDSNVYHGHVIEETSCTSCVHATSTIMLHRHHHMCTCMHSYDGNQRYNKPKIQHATSIFFYRNHCVSHAACVQQVACCCCTPLLCIVRGKNRRCKVGSAVLPICCKQWDDFCCFVASRVLVWHA